VERPDGALEGTWVRWTEVKNFFSSTSESRHYVLDRAIGHIQFGDGKNGKIPAVGLDSVMAFRYQAGGGEKGNVNVGEIQNLATAVPGVEEVLNPMEAGGGSDTATLEQMLEIGPAQINHRDRAVTVEDFEWLARNASREVVKVRCVPNVNPDGTMEIGSINIYIVPDSNEREPTPSLELRRSVKRYLHERSAASLSVESKIVVQPPLYEKVGIRVTIIPQSLDLASQVKEEARTLLEEFLHPLKGGPEGKGWDFGKKVTASAIYVLLEELPGVDHVEHLEFDHNGMINTEFANISQHALPSAGVITVQLT
jgi:predicted phage baseplate assembly protein